ncbi:MAG: hypothetical protein EU529_05270 [Promethearchaeota archaeon]|nr:MAG: hypothetical protein EU529_05270 [Candidatus Lokiarchaeota archaeon]
MRFKLDENTPFILKNIIEKKGNYKVDSVFHEKLTGIDDKSLNHKCFDNKQILITLDTDFINITDPFYGIIVLRPKTQGKKAVKTLFEDFMIGYNLKDVIGKIIIVEPNQIRIRA